MQKKIGGRSNFGEIEKKQVQAVEEVEDGRRIE